MNTHQQALTEYLAAFITGLFQTGVRDVVISPGSRSTPLALLMVEHQELNTYINIDERSAGFFALGLAKASKSPVVLLCTSGTAAANYFPAVVEANLSRVPLLVLTADRPHELREVGAPQAINQLHLYGQHVKWFAEMALPENSKEQLTYSKMVAHRAVKECKSPVSGPVHVNFPLREPLLPALDPYPFSEEQVDYEVVEGELVVPEVTIERIAKDINQSQQGLIICGPMDEPLFSNAVIELAEKLAYPILADPLSQLRLDNSLIIDSYDAILKTESVLEKFQPDFILRFGAMPVSKPLSLFTKKHRGIPHFVVDGQAGWRDPYQLGTKMIQMDETAFCQQMTKYVMKNENNKWLSYWQQIDHLAKMAIKDHMSAEQELEEGKVFYELFPLLPKESAIFVGNSMPIRDVDSFFHKNNRDITVMANRGANGIDGVVSTALGASVYQQPLFLLIGDLSFFHDMNGLLAAKLYELNITIIIVNNDGGGIFSYLPQAESKQHFEVLFGTPTGLDFHHAVQLYNGQYTKITDWDHFSDAIQSAAQHQGLNVIEIPTDRAKNLTSHRKMWDQVSREITTFLHGVEK
ncbi:2-succinyl-5-enolpyruvyl-6-hydroxy-3-cyclohexene-1-carboxylic-acid synthase [Lederbergia galactosidilytica]|uniref:2-succinyl-5-enolpyruvyl-6-hydroxy-3-cyclohexene-1-carboxylate synthase n=1 Tax=Lederbergia galactosidilytica TaxID=217031 RepID=A0A177ZXL8_9BACI|nr:2-succinyl-5-enolpyruvyl-6-hydroxy-3-cyclohexene-1-carboxylic-acid synthase [Lederbergia galactosidilytica]KRG16115.1 2-succinyl-5-enolpyruvyl-6-hydroxy-3-cyclohexene-1-carboxylate synthase [Virgibacillus soli]OAK72651.1 2-succinyl-5-enolpyruvyl-6-hydroxy-3-cyclohexene-1-carboxylate synthase [Lederbergia galactosidilytica]OAK74778.1 2-succinyl-5-enolpyruvyl-6-hydroxy-3-cyclohexene-1-carboxylate synthase [Lederbergia galactosidilytica]